MISPIISYSFTIKSDTKNLITWDLKWFWEFPIFLQVKVVKMSQQAKDV
jgi:hypothetical protein